MSNTRELKCEERIDENLKRTIIEIARCFGDSKAAEARYEQFNNDILSIDSVVVHKVLLSWGGPSDFFEIHVDPKNHEIVEIWYVFQDWFDGARRKLEDGSKEFEYVERMFGYLAEDY